MKVRPTFTIVSDEAGEIASGNGNPGKAKAGRQPITAVTDGIFSKLAREVTRHVGRSVEIESIVTLDHREEVRFIPAQRSPAFAVVLEFEAANAPRGEKVSNHKLVLFLWAIGETEKNLQR